MRSLAKGIRLRGTCTVIWPLPRRMSRLWAPLLPLGILQLYKSVNSGYFEARELKFLTNDTNAAIEWLRLPGDVVFIVGGALPALFIAYLGIRHTVKRVTLEEPEDILFTEIATTPDDAAAAAEASAARIT